VQPGDKVYVKLFRRQWFDERREGPSVVVRSTGTAVQVKGSPKWYHLSHCVQVPKEEALQSQSPNDEDKRQSGERHEDLQNQNREEEPVGAMDDSVHTVDGARINLADSKQREGFGDIDFSQAPGTSKSVSRESEGAKSCDSSDGGRDVERPRSPRPVRKRVRPKRYGD